MQVVASLSQGRTAAAQCGLFTHKSVPVIFEPTCTLETTNLLVMSYYLLCTDVCSLGHCVASWTSTVPGSICDVAVRNSYILIVARGLGTWASACLVLHPVLLQGAAERIPQFGRGIASGE